MTPEQIAKTIKEEFHVICVVSKDYYIWNPPPDVFDDKLRQLRKQIEQRIAELERGTFSAPVSGWHEIVGD